MQQKKILFLASDCESSRWVYNALVQQFVIEHAIIEQPISKKTLFKNRIKRIGLLKVTGQALFSILVVPFLRSRAKKRRAQLEQQYQLNGRGFDAGKTDWVSSVNDDTCRQILQQFNPDIIIVNGTRIISKKTLQCTNAVFINMHVGITPWYRGSHGGYWALYNNDAKNFGTTIHLVDAGVDTGAVLQQVFAKPSKEDNFTTYPVIQVAEGIQILKQVIDAVAANNHFLTHHTEKGNMYYQPTIWQYFKKTRYKQQLIH